MSEWMKRAACRDLGVAMFFPSKDQDTRPAKALCATCSVVAECHADACRSPRTQGIWGGMSEKQRRDLRIGPRKRVA